VSLLLPKFRVQRTEIGLGARRDRYQRKRDERSGNGNCGSR
jgi:hypothetical protein